MECKMSLAYALDMAHSVHAVRDAVHLVWFIMELSGTPYVLRLALTVVLCA